MDVNAVKIRTVIRNRNADRYGASFDTRLVSSKGTLGTDKMGGSFDMLTLTRTPGFRVEIKPVIMKKHR